MLPQRVVEEINTNRQRYVAELTDFLRIPSVSTDSEYAENTRQSAEWVVNKLKKLGFQTELRETAGHPVVCGHLVSAASLPTLLIYGHYDVHPWMNGLLLPSPRTFGTVTSMRGAPPITRDNALPISRPWKRYSQ